jgi:hypothetical protein
MKDLTKKLEQFREIEPDEKYWHINRSILLNTIEADTVKEQQQGFRFKSLFFNINVFARSIFPTMKVITTSFIIIVTVLVTGLGVQASGPDDFLFPGKLIMEKGELLLAKNFEKNNIYFKHIENRLKEIDELILKAKIDHIVKATKNIESNLQEVKESLEVMKKAKNVDNKKVVELATLIDLKTNEISENLKEKTVEVKNDEIKKTIKASDSLSKEALGIIITSDAELADSDLELIENSINNKIELQKDRFEEIGEKIGVAKTPGENLLISEEEGLSPQSGIPSAGEEDLNSTETSTTTLEEENEEAPVEFNIDEISDINSEEISEKLKEAKKFLNEKNYVSALRKLKEAEFYIDLTDEATNKALEDVYKKDIEELEQKIQGEIKGETEQVLE